ncbi:hypothetical protein N7504_007590 [Penicillium tannophilum]|nr:hypothetical protein N7504_007590 [Penicillium tannophilum]
MTDLMLGMDDWDDGGVPLTYFHHFIAFEPLSLQEKVLNMDLSVFMNLPLEIKRIVFNFCDPPTIFRLMQTSSFIRRECSDIFWKNDIWYRPHRACPFLKPIHHCPEFASRVKQVELELPHFLNFKRQPDRTFQKFWNTLQERYPSAQAFVFIYDYLWTSHLPPSTVNSEEYFAIYELVASTPQGITTRVAKRHSDWPGHILYQVQPTLWTIVEDPWVPMRVVLPARRVPHDLPLHNYLVHERSLYCCIRQQIGREWLIQQTYALHSPDENGEEFKCSQPSCDYTVARWWDFEAHHRIIHGYNKRDIYGMFPYHPDTAAEMKATIDEKGRRMANECSDIAILEDTNVRDEEVRKRQLEAVLQFDEVLEGGLTEYGIGHPPS